ncbi:MAG: hypothetical protein ABI407_05650 [Bradyrhizobium sp.]
MPEPDIVGALGGMPDPADDVDVIDHAVIVPADGAKREGTGHRFHLASSYAAFNAILFFRRYAMKPTPAKPRIIIAHVSLSRLLVWLGGGK